MDELLIKRITKDHLATPQAIIVILILGAGGCIALDTAFVGKIVTDPIWRVASYVVVELVIYLIWESFRRALPKKLDADTIAIVIGIESSDTKGRERIDIDLTEAFHKLIADNKLTSLITVLTAENYQAKQINKTIKPLHEGKRNENCPASVKEEWAQIHGTINGDFYLWGKIYQRETKAKYVLDFNGYIDEDLPPHIQHELSSDYNTLWAKKRLVEESEEIEGFAVEAQFYYIIAKSIIAFATLYKGNLNISHTLHNSLERDLQNAISFEGREYLMTRVRKRLSIEHFEFARPYYYDGKWDLAEEQLNLCIKYDSQNPSGYLMKAVIQFWKYRNVKTAMQFIYQARDHSPSEDGTWRYSEAFLYMYNKNYVAALQCYNYIFKNPFKDEKLTIDQVLGFFNTLLKVEPKFIESYLILGLVHGKKQGNYVEAFNNISRFLIKSGKAGRYKYLRSLAKEYKRELLETDEVKKIGLPTFGEYRQ